jgi:hypothetical protein
MLILDFGDGFHRSVFWDELSEGGAERRAFHTTHWSVVLAAGGAAEAESKPHDELDSGAQRAALERLLST